MTKKTIILYSISFLMLIGATKLWSMFIQQPIRQATHMVEEKIAASQAAIDVIKDQPTIPLDHQLSRKDLMTPLQVSTALSMATPKQKEFSLKTIKKTTLSPSSYGFKINYDVEGEATYQQFLAFLTALTSQPGVFFESIQYTKSDNPMGHFFMHIYAYSEA